MNNEWTMRKQCNLSLSFYATEYCNGLIPQIISWFGIDTIVVPSKSLKETCNHGLRLVFDWYHPFSYALDTCNMVCRTSYYENCLQPSFYSISHQFANLMLYFLSNVPIILDRLLISRYGQCQVCGCIECRLYAHFNHERCLMSTH